MSQEQNRAAAWPSVQRMGPSSSWGAVSSVQVRSSISHPIPVSQHALSLRGARGGVAWLLAKVSQAQEHPRGLLAAVEMWWGAGLSLHPAGSEASTSQTV